tara:strand:+ start:945 stop:1520 length:576 start_codon:yes stop_codon:yes gene_type:complete
MSKYLETKKGSIESAVLEAMSPAQQAAIAISKKEKGEKPKNEEKVECPKCKGEGCDHCDGKGYHMTTKEDKEAYEKFFNAALKKFGVDSPADFKSDEEKKKFFNYVDKNYKGENEKAEEVKEGKYVGDTGMVEKAAKHISDLWKEAAKSKTDEEKHDKKDKKEEKHDGKTMTGKPANKIDVTPTTDEEKDK